MICDHAKQMRNIHRHEPQQGLVSSFLVFWGMMKGAGWRRAMEEVSRDVPRSLLVRWDEILRDELEKATAEGYMQEPS